MRELLNKIGIECIGAVPLAECKITKQYLLDKNKISQDACVIPMLLPYRSELAPENLSVYASVRDYHAFVDILRKEVDKYLLDKGIDKPHMLFADHSPINEVHACCIAGLGFIGDNGLLINEKYSSFVFLCELIIDAEPSVLGLEYTTCNEVKRCIGCGACARACPSNCMDKTDPRPKSECLSAITQKKGTLTEGEVELMLKNGSVWGCDACQNVCPYTKNAEYTKIEFFKQGIILRLDIDTIEKMSDEEFFSRPFSWRGREVILRNLHHFEKGGNA